MNIDKLIPPPEALWSPSLPPEARRFLQDLLYQYRVILPTAHLWVDVGWDINFTWDLERTPPTLYVGEDWCEEPDEFWFLAGLLRARYVANGQLVERNRDLVLLPCHRGADEWSNCARKAGANYPPGAIVGYSEVHDYIEAEARKHIAERPETSHSD